MNGQVRNVANDIPLVSTVYSYRTGSRAGRSQTNSEILRSAQQNTSPYDNGHEFWTKKQEYILSHPLVNMTNDEPGRIDTYRGPLQCAFELFSKPNVYFSTPEPALLTYYGQRFIDRTRPTQPRADISQFLGELNRLPTFLIDGSLQTFAKAARLAGGQYLNVAFGWKPFISDLVKWVSNLLTLQKQLEQYLRDSGRVVRRRAEDPRVVNFEVKSTLGFVNGGCYFLDGSDPFGRHYFNTPDSNAAGTAELWKTTTEQYKFSGAYMYYLETKEDLWSQITLQGQLARKLLGVDLSPNLLYQLAPWSWLVDWVTNLGTAIRLADAFSKDGLVLRYGYLQRETIVDNTMAVKGIRYDRYNPGLITSTFRTHWKERFRASPYGFALNPNEFSVGQWAILAALGLTKAPGILRRY
jgi:hypothetical protein